MDTLELSQFLGIAGAGALINVVLEAVKRAAQWTQETTERLAPLVSLLLGILIFVPYTILAPPVDVTAGIAIMQAIITGIVAGGTAAGIYQLGGKAVIRSVAGTPSGEQG